MSNRSRVVPIAAAALWSWLFGAALIVAIPVPGGLPALLARGADRQMLVSVVAVGAFPAAVLAVTALRLPTMPLAQFGLVLVAKTTTASLISAALAALAVFSFFAFPVSFVLSVAAVVSAVGTYLVRRRALPGVLLTLAVLAGCLAASLWVSHLAASAVPPARLSVALTTVLIVAAIALTVGAARSAAVGATVRVGQPRASTGS